MGVPLIFPCDLALTALTLLRQRTLCGTVNLLLERIQSKYALANGVRGGFVLRKKPLGGMLPGYSNSGFAISRSAEGERSGVICSSCFLVGRSLRNLEICLPRQGIE
jgi:hypothetical protein